MAVSTAPRSGGHTAGTALDVEAHDQQTAMPNAWVSAGIFVIFAAIYTIIGYRTTVDGHVIVFDSLDRLTRGYLVWHNNPPKLAAVGFVFPPLTTMAFLFGAIVKPVATSLVALPLTSGVFAGGSVALLDRVLARCDMDGPLRVLPLALFAFNPYWLFYAGNGMSEVVYTFFLVFALYGFVSWYATTEPRFLIAAGFGLAVLVLLRYGFIIFAALFAVLIGVALVRRRASNIEVEGSIIAFAAPVIYVLAIWILFNALIIGHPFGWISDTTTSTQAVNATGIDTTGGLHFDDVARRLLQLNVAVFPLAFAVVPALVVTFIAQRNDMALWLAAFVVLGVVIIGVHAYSAKQEGLLTLRDSMPMFVASFIGAAWLFRSLEGARIVVWGLTIALLIVNLFTAWHGMRHYPFQSLEQAFTRTLFSGDDQEGRASIGGYRVGIANEASMADRLKSLPQKRNSILADNSQTFGVILLYGRPQNIFDRIDKGDKKFNQILANPWGKVDYLLLTTNANSSDLIRRKYPNANSGSVAGLTPIFRNERYVLVRVDRTKPRPARSTARRPAARGRQTFRPMPNATRTAPVPATTAP